ncbi:MAG: aspartate carbamoyltransferase catalytic subunit [Chthoniobacterales bacterium]
MRADWKHKDLLALDGLTLHELEAMLDAATAFKRVGLRSLKKVPALRGRTFINFFVEPSTRTRISFELAALRLSADVINIATTSSSQQKGETLKDTAKNLEALHADIIVLRHSSPGAAKFLSERLQASIINAGDGAHEHPTQGLLDIFTMREHLGSLTGKKIGIVGDIRFSRVARSNIHGLVTLGAEVILIGPTTLVPKNFENMGVRVCHKLDDVVEELDVINLLRIQQERQRKEYFPSLNEYVSLFGLTKQRAERLKKECLIMHPGPINRGIEIDSDVADGPRSVILDQVSNGLAVRMAALYLCAGGEGAI